MAQPISAQTGERMKQLIEQLIAQITGKNDADPNATGGKITTASDRYHEALLKRQASRKARRVELVSLRSQKKKSDNLKTSDGKNAKRFIHSIFHNFYVF